MNIFVSSLATPFYLRKVVFALYYICHSLYAVPILAKIARLWADAALRGSQFLREILWNFRSLLCIFMWFLSMVFCFVGYFDGTI
jgi:hypothetical protein